MQAWQTKFVQWARPSRPPAAVAGGRRILLADIGLLPVSLCRELAVLPERVIILAAENATAENLAAVLRVYLDLVGDARPILHVPPASTPGRNQWIPENEAARSAAFDAAVRRTPAIFMAAAAAALARTLPPRLFTEHTLDLGAGADGWSPETLAATLTAMDYDNEIEVHVPGEFARRGGIVDLFSPLYPDPVRIEFFGNRIESMRFFRADTQLSLQPVERIRVIPRSDSPLAPGPDHAATFLDYLDADVPCIVCNPAEIGEHLLRFSDAATVAAWDAAMATDRPRLVLETVAAATGSPPSALADSANATAAPAADLVSLTEVLGAHLGDLGHGTEAWGWEQARRHLRKWHDDGYALVAFCATPSDAARLREILLESEETRPVHVATHIAVIDAGIMIPPLKLVFLSERELFGRRAPPRALKLSPYRLENLLRDSADIEEGAHAVHAAHGICIYHGIREIEITGRTQEALELEFADKARLYVPLDQVCLVSRYIGGTKKPPKLSRLGGAAWKNARGAAADAAMDMAAELLRIAAIREHSPGFAHGEDNAWEKLFAASFPYTETEDQHRAIAEVLGDMSRPRPMDRLLCGDVGYGKTEVAIRAAFRAVLNGKQVAVLVPTTVLAQQHFRTFRDRLAEYPVRIEMLSRFRSRGEQRDILASLAAGRLDVLIGTHRLLQDDVHFPNLGLLVIDEEQRFGVEHKEILKRLRAEVDILTMTATPIPRTLYLGLAGLRNLSTILSPPVDRLPITTIVCQYDETVIRGAILRELDRKGQVFLLHNRVQTIDRFAAHFRRLVPEARYGIGHGQMPADELEEVMARFIDGEIDVLVCTTIIESGLDIPNANTILIDHAERFGLADLYQLRGRVGRYHHQAFAYFLLPPASLLPTNARQRLAAIRRYTQLGAGFKLALRDLEIRGSGNILGGEQSGHIAKVGFELYCELLREAAAHLEQKTTLRRPEIPIAIDTVCLALHDRLGRLPAALPPEYMGAEITRLECYRRLRSLRTLAEIDAFAAELADRFGPPPLPVQALLEFNRIRVLAQQAGLTSLTVRDGRVLLERETGLLRTKDRQVPRLKSQTPLEQLCELRSYLARLSPNHFEEIRV